MNPHPSSSARICNSPRSILGIRFIHIQIVLLLISLNLAGEMPTYAAKRPVPAAPSNLFATAISASEIDLSWTDNSSNETGFTIQRGPTTSGPWSQIATVGGNVTSYKNTGLNASTAYYYRVCAYNSNGSSSFAGPATATTAPACTDTVTSSVSPTGAGTSTGGGTFNCNSIVTVTASPAAGYGFANWTENGTVVSGTASYTFTATANRSLVANFTVIPCTFSVASTNGTFAAAGGNGSINVTTTGGTSCNWTAVSGVAWITITGGASGSGNGTVSYTVAANTTAGARTGTITVAGQAVTVSQAASTNGDITSNLVGYWTLDTESVSATTALDSSGNGGNATLMGTTLPNVVPGKIAEAIDLTDASQCVDVSDSTNLNLIGSFTVAAWVNFSSLPSPGQYPNVVAKLASPAGYYGYGLFWNGTGVSGIIGPGSAMWYTTAPYIPSPGTWYHFVSAFDGTYLRLYVNGAQYAQVAATAPGSTANIPIKIGPHYSNPTAYGVIKGMFDEVRIYGRALSATDVAQLYNYAGSGCTYAITTSSSPSGAGATTGGGTVTCGSPTIVTASPATGYNFVNWTENGSVMSTSASYTFTPNASGSLVANFAAAPCTYAITTSSSPIGGGSTSGGGTVNCGSSVTVTATPAACYRFVNWTLNGTAVSSSASYSFTANATQSLVAIFAPITYTVSAGSAPAAGGSVSGGGTFNCGSSVTVSATPAACYSFVNWTENGTVVSSSPNYTFSAAANRSLVANFTPVTYTVSAGSSPVAGGSVSGGGTVSCGSSVTVTATAASCYSFANWTENGTVVSSSPNYTFSATANRNLVANFTQVTYSVTAGSSPAVGGSVSGGGTVSCGSSVTVTATSASCYSFANWTENGTVVSSSPNYTFSAAANRNLVANFTPITYTVGTSSSPASSGSMSGGGTVNCGSSVTVTATPASCYSFANWTENGTVVSSSPNYTFTAAANRSLVANFTMVTYTVAAGSSPATGGSVNGGGTVNCGSSVMVTATPASGYSFSSWTENGTLVSGSASYSFTAAANRNLMANFSATPCTFSLSSGSAAFGAATGNGSVSVNASSGTCGWNASTSYSWLHTSSSGTGSGLANYSVDANTSSVARSGSLTIAGQTFTVTQSGHSSPVANAGPNQTTSVGTALTFNGSASFAQDGAAITNYAWALGDLTSASGISFAHAYSSPGTYTVTLTVTDSMGASGSGNCTVVVTNVLCALNPVLTAPNSGATVSNTITLTATASACATRVEFYCDNTVLVGTATAAPYNVSWNTTSAANGSHSVCAKAYDATGNSTTSPSSTVTVSNVTTLVAGQLQWAQGGVVTALYGQSRVLGMAADSSGNVIAVGDFQYSLSLGSITLTSAGGRDGFIVKYNSQGAVQWAKSFGSTVDGEAARAVAVDSAGNIIVTGCFGGNVDFGGVTLSSPANPSSPTYAYYLNTFVAKYSAAGGLLWAQAFGGVGFGLGRGVAVDGSGNVFFGASFQASATIGGVTLTSAGADDIALAKLSAANGSVLWAKRYGGTDYDQPHGLAVDRSGNLLVTGSFGTTIDLGGGSLSSVGSSDGFVAKYSGVDGSYIWAKAFGTASPDMGNGVAVDPTSGNVIVGGTLGGAFNFGTGLTTSAGIFLAAYDGSGNNLWAKTFNTSIIPANGNDSGNAVGVDANGNIVLCGAVTASINFGGGWLNAANNGSFFMAGFSSSGAYRWAKRASGTAGSAAYGLAIDTLGHASAGGSIAGATDFGGVSLTTTSPTTATAVAQYGN
jgi:hypothetical protein